MKMIWFKTTHFFVARQSNESIKTVLNWGAAKFRVAEQSIMLNPDPIVQTSANGFAFMGSMNQDKKSRDQFGMVQDYQILPDLLTLPRKFALMNQKKQEKTYTQKNSGSVSMMLEGLRD